MARTGVVEFFRQVKQEGIKVTWGTRKEVVQSTSVVLVMVVIAALYFLVVDAVLFNVVQLILGL